MSQPRVTASTASAPVGTRRHRGEVRVSLVLVEVTERFSVGRVDTGVLRDGLGALRRQTHELHVAVPPLRCAVYQ